MTAFRFIHSADLHLGRRFGNLPEEIRGRLVEARHAALGTLAATARAQGAQHILLAGDTFDSETPTDPVWRQALAAMADSPAHWWVLPGNHDSLGAETLWQRLAAHAPKNVHVLHDIDPVELAPGAMLLPAPLPRRRPGRDLTAWMPGCATDPRALRIGLAHGAVRDFSEDGAGAEGIIPPDRAETAGLDYLALGDWHGQMTLSPRCAYAGTPEQDGFRHAARGGCLAVTLDGPGAPPRIARVETGRFLWLDLALELLPGLCPETELTRLLPGPGPARRDILVRLQAQGRAGLAEQQTLRRTAARLSPEFCHFVLETADLATEFDAADLDAIDHGGALRAAAETLAQESRDDRLAAADRAIAAGALNRLYGMLQGEAE
ncbi:metallophosphoesterase family protein [Phaeovulum vinaykumarii]|uniref:DNA repair exonuclease SbcCD nuclease subunit n=1 Tax=Phaeovulum vinaykumarii TaxID=407234 RepID=A0A1N7KPF5_9RHOB|nr:metallophosphoesterase [Phaeovulum vinaykumarii]SIS63522.1 DNA repair exonuclease SbcCD nuclease subunit [Phaeovulum vinaykumarii]SOC01896.1 DNA repair exonuclease SbcCD nuclease subunit [Phaeovulum vinaykumarii]